MSHNVPGPPDFDVMTEQVPGLNGPKMLGRHKPTAPNLHMQDNKVIRTLNEDCVLFPL